MDLCNTSKEEQDKKKEPELYKTLVQNVDFEYISISKTVSDNFSSNTINVENTRYTNLINCTCLSPSMSIEEILEDSVILALNNLLSFFDDDQNNNIVAQNIHREQEVFEHSKVISFLPLNSPSPNFTTTDEHSTFQNNSLTRATDSSIPSSLNLSNQIEDFISHECIQKGLVPYKTNTDLEFDYENYPEKNKKRKKSVQIQKSNWFAERNRKLRENRKKYNERKKRKEKWN